MLSDSSRSTPIMSTNIVAFLLLNKFRDGCTLDKLVEAFDSMRQEMERKDKNVAFCGETVDIVEHAVSRRKESYHRRAKEQIYYLTISRYVPCNTFVVSLVKVCSRKSFVQKKLNVIPRNSIFHPFFSQK